MSNSLDLDQSKGFGGPDLGQNYKVYLQTNGLGLNTCVYVNLFSLIRRSIM